MACAGLFSGDQSIWPNQRRRLWAILSLKRLAVCECSDFQVCFVLEPFGVSDGPLSLHVERVLSRLHRLV